MLTALHRVYVRVTCCLLDAAVAREPRGLVFHFDDNMSRCKGKLSRPQPKKRSIQKKGFYTSSVGFKNHCLRQDFKLGLVLL